MLQIADKAVSTCISTLRVISLCLHLKLFLVEDKALYAVMDKT